MFAKEHAEIKGVQSLSPEIQNLLSREMIALEGGMMDIIPNMVSGNYAEIEKIAIKIKESFILKKKLTQKQRHELHEKLPSSFIEMDASFHRDAGMLAHVSKNKNSDLVNFYFFKMTNACVSCHSKFATHKFPLFKNKAIDNNHKH